MANFFYLDKTGTVYLIGKIKAALAGKVNAETGKGLSQENFTTALKQKLEGLSNYSLPTASTTIKGGVKVGANLTMDGETLNAADTTYSDATASVAGLMSAADKQKLNGIAANANNYSLPTASGSVKGGIQIGSNLSMSGDKLNATDTKYSIATSSAGGLMSSADKVKLDGLSNYVLPTMSADTKGGAKLGSNLTMDGETLNATDTTYTAATADAAGLMSAADKEKLDGVAAGANAYSLPTASASVKGGIKIGTNLTMSGDKLSATDTTYSNATISVAGLMSKSDKSKLDGIASGAQVNKIETIKVNGSALSISSKAVNIIVPTNNNQLSNGAGYQTASQVADAVANAVGSITGFSYEVVTSLPATGAAGKVYLISNSGAGQNVYDEYIWIGSKYEKLGTTEMDLSNYLMESELTAITNSEIDTAWSA